MNNDLEQNYLDIVQRNKNKSKVFRKVILVQILLSIVIVVISPSLVAILLLLVLATALIYGVLFALSMTTESEALKAYEVSIGKDNTEGKLDVEQVIDDYINDLKD